MHVSHAEKLICTRSIHLPQYYSVEFRPYICSNVIIYSCTYYQILYKGILVVFFPSTFVQDLVIRTTMYQNVRANIRSEFHRVVLQEVNYTLTIYFFIRHMCFSNLRVLLELLLKILANIAIYYAILIILQVYTSSFTQFRPLLL